MTARDNYGRRKHDIPQCVVELIRHCPEDQLIPKFAAIVNALLLRADEFDKDGWYGMDCVADGLGEAVGCLDDVRAPGHERSQQEEYELQRDQRAFMFGGYR